MSCSRLRTRSTRPTISSSRAPTITNSNSNSNNNSNSSDSDSRPLTRPTQPPTPASSLGTWRWTVSTVGTRAVSRSTQWMHPTTPPCRWDNYEASCPDIFPSVWLWEHRVSILQSDVVHPDEWWNLTLQVLTTAPPLGVRPREQKRMISIQQFLLSRVILKHDNDCIVLIYRL